MKVNTFPLCILCTYLYENENKCMLPWSKQINTIFKREFSLLLFLYFLEYLGIII